MFPDKPLSEFAKGGEVSMSEKLKMDNKSEKHVLSMSKKLIGARKYCYK